MSLAELVAAHPSNTQWKRDLQISIGRTGGTAYNLVLNREFVMALEAADRAISLAPDEIWIYRNRAHALMFLGRVDEARMLYLKYRGTKKMQGDKSWEAVEGDTWETIILKHFAQLRRAGLSHPLMDEIESKFTTNG